MSELVLEYPRTLSEDLDPHFQCNASNSDGIHIQVSGKYWDSIKMEQSLNGVHMTKNIMKFLQALLHSLSVTMATSSSQETPWD